MTATQSQIRDAISKAYVHSEKDDMGCIIRQYIQLDVAYLPILQSALDTQKPAGDAGVINNSAFRGKSREMLKPYNLPGDTFDDIVQQSLIAALAGKPKDGGDLVHTVYVVEDDFTHIFSTEKLAKEFADTKECPCVISTYLIDNPERFYEAVQ